LEKEMKKNNPRWSNGNFRRKIRARFKAAGYPCHICGKPIHYDEPSDSKHPWSFVVDEIVPCSRYREGGYGSPEEACRDVSNLAPAHYYCNNMKSNHMPGDRVRAERRINLPDGTW
jgi:5-methylcytosine-specific restriction endonuclease McrA